MGKFYKKYELGIKVFLMLIAVFVGSWKIFLNTNFDLFFGIVWLVVTMFLLLDDISELIRKRKLNGQGK